MANLYLKQGKQYSESRPGYPEELFQFIASKSTQHDLAWDVGTGSGQVAKSGCEKEVAEATKGDSEEQKAGSIMRLSWALVHSRQPDDVKRGIAMLEASLANKSSSPLEEREKLYLLAVGNYRSDEFSKSRKLLEKCLEISPDWRQALTLKNMVEERITKDGVIGIGITATTVGLIVGGLAAALARR